MELILFNYLTLSGVGPSILTRIYIVLKYDLFLSLIALYW